MDSAREDRAVADEIPYLTTEQMVEVDRAMIEDYRIELIQMMESAGRNLAHLAGHVSSRAIRAAGVEAQVGELYLADISVPPELYAEEVLGLEVGSLFAKDDIVPLR